MATKTTTNPKISAIFDYIIEVEGAFPYEQRQMFTAKKSPDTKMILIMKLKQVQKELMTNLKLGKIISHYIEILH